MNQSVHQLLQLILQGITWVVRTIERLWVWSWTQIMSVFSMSWDSLPAWKLAVGVIAMLALAAILFVMLKRALHAFGRIADAFWTMLMMAFGVMAFMLVAGLFSVGFQWVVRSVPDKFWEKFI